MRLIQSNAETLADLGFEQAHITSRDGEDLDFAFGVTRQALDQATGMGAAQQGCAGMFGTLRTTRAVLLAEPELRHILCVGADSLPPGASRKILYNVISDAAVACVVSPGATRDRRLGFHPIPRNY